MSETKVVDQRRYKSRMERHIREHCLHRVVKNDGAEMRRLFERDAASPEVRHIGNFVFEVTMPRFDPILIWTEPMDEEEAYIRIIGYSISM